MTVSIREYADRDRDEVLKVMRASLGETEVLKRTGELFDWKHNDNPFGRSIMLVAEVDGEMAGFRAFMRWELATPEGETIRGVRPVDTATHPDHQRKGIFRMLTESAIELATEDGVDLVFNTPNRRSGAGYLKMGWSRVGSIGVMVRPGWRFAGHTEHLTGAHPVMHVSGTDRRPFGFRTVRSTEYREWRFRRHPTATYHQFGDTDDHVICRSNIRNGLRELVVSETVGAMTGPLSAMSLASRSHYGVGWFRPGSPERSALARHGFVPVPGMTAMDLVARPLRSLPLDPLALVNWDIGFGDLELL